MDEVDVRLVAVRSDHSIRLADRADQAEREEQLDDLVVADGFYAGLRFQIDSNLPVSSWSKSSK